MYLTLLVRAGMHEHRPSHLAPAEERERIIELNRKLEAKRAAEQAAKKAADEAAEAASKAAKLKETAEAAAKVPEILHASSADLSDAESLLKPKSPSANTERQKSTDVNLREKTGPSSPEIVVRDKSLLVVSIVLERP